MFEKEYQETFSQVTPSQETTRRILTMKQYQSKYEAKKKKSFRGTAGKILVAAAALSVLTVTAAAAAQHWFAPYFSEKGTLNQEQESYLSQQEKPLGQSQTQGGWTVSLLSALSDSQKGYIMLGVTAPGDVDLTALTASTETYFGPRNDFLPKSEDTALRCDAYPDVQGVIGNIGTSWKEDGDGKNNTMNWVIDVSPDPAFAEKEPLAPDTNWHIHLQDWVRGFPEQETIGEGTWDFDFAFASDTREISLLSGPKVVRAYAMPGVGEEKMAEITLTKAVLRPLSLTLFYGGEEDGLDYSRTSVSLTFDLEMEKMLPVYAVMKDGVQIALRENGGNPVERYINLESEMPLILEEVDYILLPDGTKLPVPQK